MLQHPSSEREVVVAHGDVQHPPCARAVASHAEHFPFGVAPVCLPAALHGFLVDHLEEPQHATVESGVVDDLNVKRVRAALEEEPRERVSLQMRRPILFTLSDDADEWRVPAPARHEVRVRVGAGVQQGASDR